MSNQKDLVIEPNNPSGGEMLFKVVVGAIVGLMIAFLIFVIIILVGGMFNQAVQNRMTGSTTTNPLLPLILIIIGFLTSLIGNIIISGVYNLFYANKYYDLGKMFSLNLIANILLFFIFSPLYIVFYNNIILLFMILAFHIMFSAFVSSTLMESFTNPNYSGAYIIGTSIGLSVSILIFGIIYKITNINETEAVQIFLISPAIIAYTIMPLISNLWQKIYYKFYQMGNNFLYLPSINEVLIDESETDEINVN